MSANMILAYIFGTYGGMVLLMLYVPPFFPKLYRWLHNHFDGNTVPTAPPYVAIVWCWPILIPIVIVGEIASRLPSPSSIAEWIEERQTREQRKREAHADKFL